MKKILFLLLSFNFIYTFNIAQNASLNMVRTSQWNPAGMPSNTNVIYNDIWGYTTSTGEEYAIIGNVDSVLVVDVTDPFNPTRVYGFFGGNTTTWRDFKTYGNYLYAVCDCNEGLHIFDMSGLPNGNVTHVLTTTSFFTNAHNIYIDVPESKLYAVGVSGPTDVVVLDLSSTPASPTLMANGNINFNLVPGVNPAANYYVHDVYVRSDTAYCSHGNLGFYVWDLSDLANIDLLGDFKTGGYNHSSWINDAGTHSYYAEEVPNGLPMGIMDLANLGSGTASIDTVKTFVDPIITTVSNYPTPHNPFVKNDTLYISYYKDGIKAYDVSTPTNPVLIGYYDTYPTNTNYPGGYDGAWGVYPFFDSGTIIASDDTYGLNVITMTNPLRPCDGTSIHFSGLIPDDTAYHADDFITTDGILNPLNSAYFQARNSIELQSGFETSSPTGDFEVVIGPCDNSSLLTNKEIENK